MFNVAPEDTNLFVQAKIGRHNEDTDVKRRNCLIKWLENSL